MRKKLAEVNNIKSISALYITTYNIKCKQINSLTFPFLAQQFISIPPDPVYYLVHRLVGITLSCRLIIAWLIQMTPWLWWYSAHPQCLKMPSCLSWSRGVSRGFLTPSTSVWDIVCPLLSYRSVQCIFINLVWKMGKAEKNVLSMKWWSSNICNSFRVVEVFFWLFGLDRMRFSKMSLHVSHIKSNGSTQRTGFWNDIDMIFLVWRLLYCLPEGRWAYVWCAGWFCALLRWPFPWYMALNHACWVFQLIKLYLPLPCSVFQDKKWTWGLTTSYFPAESRSSWRKLQLTCQEQLSTISSLMSKINPGPKK